MIDDHDRCELVNVSSGTSLTHLCASPVSVPARK